MVGQNRSVLRVFIGVIVILSVMEFLPFGDVSEPAVADDNQGRDWPMFRHDLNRTGNTSSPAPNTNEIDWTHQTPWTRYTWGYASSPAVVDDVVYQGSQWPNIMRAIDVETGIQDWQANVGRVTSSPMYSNGQIFIGSYSQGTYAVDEATGGINWFAPQNDWVDSSAIVYDGKVYIGEGIGDYVPSRPSRLYCLDELTGAVIWTFQAGGQIVSSPTIAEDKVIFGSYDLNIYALPTEDPNGDGTLDLAEAAWVYTAGTRVVSSAAVADGVVYIGGLNGKLYALPLDDPNGDKMIDEDEVIWTFTTGNEIWGSPGIARGRVFIGSHDYYLYALPAQDPNGDGEISPAEVVWKFKTTDRIWSSPSIAGGKVFIGSEDSTVWAVSEETGAQIWKYKMPVQLDAYGSEYQFAQPAIADGQVFIGNWDLTLYCFGSDDATPPAVVDALPADGSVDIPLSTDVRATFDEDLTDVLITDSAVLLKSSTGIEATGQVTYDQGTRTLALNPAEDLLPNERYAARLVSRLLQDAAGNPLDGNGNGLLDGEGVDDYIWHFNTSGLVGHKPSLETASVTPLQGDLETDFEFTVIYYDQDGNPPTGDGYVRIFFDRLLVGFEMEWANNTNTPLSHLLDRDYTNGELFHYERRLSTGAHSFHIECSDGFNTNKTDEIALPDVLNSPPRLAVPLQYANEDEEHLLNLTQYADDLEGDDLVFGEDSDYCALDGCVLSCTFPEGVLSAAVNVTVDDGAEQAWQVVRYVINPVNDPPRLKPGVVRLPPVTGHEGTVYVFELGDYVTDPDTPRELLEVHEASVHVFCIGLSLYLLYDDAATENVTLTVSDGEHSLQLNLEVSIQPAEEPPPEEDDSLLLFLLGILITIIAFLVILNVWMLLRKREEPAQVSEEEEE